MKKNKKKQDLITFKEWLNKNHKGLYIKITNYAVSKYMKDNNIKDYD
jgi:hypothetical protein